MKKVISTSYGSTGLFYFSISCLGYAALGSDVPGDVLTGFNVSKAVEILANAAVLLHMVCTIMMVLLLNVP